MATMIPMDEAMELLLAELEEPLSAANDAACAAVDSQDDDHSKMHELFRHSRLISTVRRSDSSLCPSSPRARA